MDVSEDDDVISIDDILCDINQKKAIRTLDTSSDHQIQDAYHLDTATIMNMELRKMSRTDVWEE